jgi:hypothetical protein
MPYISIELLQENPSDTKTFLKLQLYYAPYSQTQPYLYDGGVGKALTASMKTR